MPTCGGETGGALGEPVGLVVTGLLGADVAIEPDADPAPDEVLVGPQAATVSVTASTPTSTATGANTLGTAFGRCVAFLDRIVFPVSMPSPPGDQSQVRTS
jgi:hypothetical protein